MNSIATSLLKQTYLEIAFYLKTAIAGSSSGCSVNCQLIASGSTLGGGSQRYYRVKMHQPGLRKSAQANER
ncbi:MAG: hypothetical protein WBB29_09295 [Geitlerinemataceae cyanobacterium]